MYSDGRLDSIYGSSVSTPTRYLYDVNGRATTDGRNNKTITYNALHLPVTVSGGITYTYDATGRKLRKVNSTSGVTTQYIDGIQYTGSTIDFIQTEEGIIRNNSGTYSYEYNLNDHLGNTRVTFYKNPSTGLAEAIQQDNYYPFGMQKIEASGTNKYLYNGKEKQDDWGGVYDYGARFYDPVVGRWMVVDPLAELSRRWSGYVYGKDNPIIFIDPDGMFDELYNNKGDKIGVDEKGVNGMARVVTDKDEVSQIKANTKNGDITQSSTIKSGASISKVALRESLNVLDRSNATGGTTETSSVVQGDGTVVQGTIKGQDDVLNGVAVKTVVVPPSNGPGSVSIHAHPTKTELQTDGKVNFTDAREPGPKDAGTFSQHSQNIIVGSLGGPQVSSAVGGVRSVPAVQGAVIYNSKGVSLVELTVREIKRIIK